ncbi:MAG: lytic transglycosylase domain-containing protein [Myxococcota bacterium]
MQTVSLTPSRGVRQEPFTPTPVDTTTTNTVSGAPAGRPSAPAAPAPLQSALPADRVADTPPAGGTQDGSTPPTLPAPGGDVPVHTRPEHPANQLPTLTTPVERLDADYLEPFSYYGQKGEFPAAISVIQIQRAFNRLLPHMADSGMEPLTVDGLMGPNTNRARMMLLEFAGVEEPNEQHMRDSDWQALSAALETYSMTPHFRIDVFRGDLSEEEANAAMLFERLAIDDPRRAQRLAEALEIDPNAPITRDTLRALVDAMAQIGVPLDSDTVQRLYTRDRSGLGGMTYMRAVNAVDLLLETEELDYDAQDAVIDEAIDWIREEELLTFVRFARVATGGDEDAAVQVLHALIKAVMSAESDFDRVTDEDVQDVGLMQLIPAVVSDYGHYFERALADDALQIESGLEPRRTQSPTEEMPASFHPATLHPVANTAAGGALLMRHFANFNGDVSWTSAAYNKGPNHPDVRSRERIPNVYSAHVHTVRTQRRMLYYLANSMSVSPVEELESRPGMAGNL